MNQRVAAISGHDRPLVALITGFGRFPGAPFNPSAAVAFALAGRRRPALAGIARVAHVLETSYACVDRDLPQLMRRHAPDIVLMLGLAARTPHLRIETRARNARSVLLPDVTGRRAAQAAIVPGAAARIGRARFGRLLAAARSARVPARLSRNAGTYLCNYTYWRGLEAAERNGTLVQLVHIPLPKRAGVTIRDLARAGEMILLALAGELHR